ncbi:uncharacterized protein LOC143875639 [Tasmannia lanceolata]|uniref:uncharacterized protein LOC143875639 n=1 Tax=Tasmannia lanceolata TaxID=3420 RepID=UPI004062AA13
MPRENAKSVRLLHRESKTPFPTLVFSFFWVLPFARLRVSWKKKRSIGFSSILGFSPSSHFSGFIQMKNLKALYLGGNMLNQSSQSLSGLCSLKRLKTLHLGFNQLDDRSLPSCLGNLSSLEDLGLSNNNLRNPRSMSTGTEWQ